MSDQHYFSPQPSVESAPEPVAIRLSDVSLDLLSDRGVFSVGALDRGTEFLLRWASDPPATGAIMDVGCGYGAIALVIAKRAPSATIWAIDVNERALELTRGNAERAGITNIEVMTPDEVPDDLRLAAVYSNPPVRVGKTEMHALLTRWIDRLDPPGVAHLVVHKHLGADSLMSWLIAQGYATERTRSRQGYRLMDVTPRGDAGMITP